MPEFGKNLLKQIRARKGREVPVILITGQYQHCVDLMIELQSIGIDGSIAKPFPTSGRTLAVVIEEVLARHRRFRAAASRDQPSEPLTPFPGGVLAYHPSHIALCGETIVEQTQRGHAWQILQVLRETNDLGKRVHRGSRSLARRLDPQPGQNTAIKAVGKLRERIAEILRQRLGYECGPEDVIGRDEQGYHLVNGIIVEVYDDDGTLTGQTSQPAPKVLTASPAKSPPRLSEKQRWVMAALAAGTQLTRTDVERQFDISSRTAKRVLGELSDAELIEFSRATHPGFYRLR